MYQAIYHAGQNQVTDLHTKHLLSPREKVERFFENSTHPIRKIHSSSQYEVIGCRNAILVSFFACCFAFAVVVYSRAPVPSWKSSARKAGIEFSRNSNFMPTGYEECLWTITATS